MFCFWENSYAIVYRTLQPASKKYKIFYLLKLFKCDFSQQFYWLLSARLCTHMKHCATLRGSLAMLIVGVISIQAFNGLELNLTGCN